MQHPSNPSQPGQPQKVAERFSYQPLHSGSPIGGSFFFLIGFIGVALESVLFAFEIGTLSQVSKLGEIIFLVYSFIFMVLGGAILFYKKVYLFDRTKQTIVACIRLPFLTWRKKEISYKHIHAVQISRKVIGAGGNVGLTFTVALVEDDRPDIPLELFFRYQNAKRVGELLSVALMKPLHDVSSGRIVVKQPGEFKSRLQDKLLANQDIRDEPLRPMDMEAFVQEQLGRMQVRIPPFGIIDALFTLLIPALVLFLFFSWISYAFLQTLPFEIIAYSLTVPTIFIVVAGSFLFRQEWLDIDSQNLIIHWNFAGFRGRKNIPLSHLEGLFIIGREVGDEKLQFLKALTKTETYGKTKDIFYPFRCLSSSIIARAGKETVHFGRSLDIEELVYLVYLIETFIRDGSLKSVE